MDFKNKTVYEVYIKSFFDSNGNGEGDIKGVIEKLDYIKSLGITTIWITPFYFSPMTDEGYDVANYFEINPKMGNMNDIDKLIARCNELNIEIMIDFVLNHTSSEHSWFKKALAGDKKYQDYYFFSNKPKTKWISRFEHSVWKYVPKIKKYYLHLYDVTQPDLNWDNPDVRKEMYKVVEYWLSKKIKACKFDVLYLISKPTSDWQPNGRMPSAIACRDGKNVHVYIKELIKKIKANFPNTYTVGEMSFSTIEECIKYSDPKNNEVDMIMTGKMVNGLHPKITDSLSRKEKDDNSIYIKNIKEWNKKIQNDNGWLCIFSENHDGSRTINRFGDLNNRSISAKAHIMSVAFLRGTPFFHQGQEIGMINPKYKNLENYVDVKSKSFIKKYKHKIPSDKLLDLLDKNGRDAGRNPMIWNNTKNGGWSKASSPWRLVPKENIKNWNVEEQMADKNSILNFFKKINLIRQKTPELIYGNIEFIETDPYILAFVRKYQNKKILVVINLSNDLKKEVIQNIKIKNLIVSNYENKKIVAYKKLLPWESSCYWIY